MRAQVCDRIVGGTLRAVAEVIPESVDACGERGEFHTMCTWFPGLYGSRVRVRSFTVQEDSEGRYVFMVPGDIHLEVKE